ncbi:MAG TPA: hypothetical protein VLX30_04925 [Burkholderiales bacterium]|nr:hypothetical protein [Burkholderiales bacterium]
MRTALLLALLFAAAPAALAYDANGVALGARESDVKEAFPSAHCQPLEWKSSAADRRCDDARISFADVRARITFYLKNDSVQAFDVRFSPDDRERVVQYLKSRYGEPLSERTETFRREGKPERSVYSVRWESGPDKALLSAQLDRRRAQLEVSRGNFEQQIYEVR